jgi:hypothetical protein
LRIKLVPLSAAALLLAGAAVAAPFTFDPARLSADDKTLGSDAFEGRGVATPAETKTIDYLVGQFKAAGLQPGGQLVNGKRVWTQDVPLLRSDHVVPPVVTINSGAKALTLRQGEEIAVRAPTNGQQKFAIDNAPLVFVGYGVSAPERGWDDFKRVDVKGKILVELINDPDFEGGEGSFGGKAMTYYGRWTYKYEEAARRGAAGVLIIHETLPASYGWATVKNSNTNTMFDIVRQNPAAEHTAFESWIQRDVATQLFANAGLDFEAMKAAAKRKDFQPVDLKATLDAKIDAKAETIVSKNVVARVIGRTHPDET